ncbi:diguanylate cyclase domain-containing protein [Pseudomonadota bacterium]
MKTTRKKAAGEQTAPGSAPINLRIVSSTPGIPPDITKRHVTETEAIREMWKRYEFIVNTSRGFMNLIDTNYVYQAVNDAFLSVLHKTREEAIGHSVADIWGKETFESVIKPCFDQCFAGNVVHVEFSLHIRKQGEAHFSAANYPYYNASNEITHAVVISHDITKRVVAEETIRKMAYHDHLTGLPNRALFYDRMQQGLAHARRHRKAMAVLMLDLDHFKPINDELGHKWGDRALVEISERLVKCVRATDTVARIGGDEFAIILVDVGAEKRACMMAEKVIAAIGTPLSLKGSQYSLSASVGISLSSPDCDDIETIVSKADSAMYQAKHGGRGRYHLSKQ